MRRVYKYQIGNTDLVNVSMPAGAKLLKAGIQGKNVVVWANVDPTERLSMRQFHVSMTGGEVPDGGTYFDTVVFHNVPGLGDYVLHIFDLGELPDLG